MLAWKKQWAIWYGKEGRFAKTEKRPGGQPSKYELITSEVDYSDPNNNHRFIQRNLVDTRYVAKEVLAILKEFAKTVEENHPFHQAKVKTINGKAPVICAKLLTLKGIRWKDQIGPKKTDRLMKTASKFVSGMVTMPKTLS
ncbi:hypothetical protein [Mycoplasma sp. ATU-Cv-508]|uniref:hypothetical protein n=1 Tax=Mycoplasma sp. ATU-Cv-508 TaxID=2048001 RepID=UPI000FDDE0D5